MSELLTFIISLSLSGSLIIVLIFITQKISRNYFRKKWNYYLWLLAIIRLLIPFSFSNNIINNLFININQSISKLLSIPVIISKEYINLSNIFTIKSFSTFNVNNNTSIFTNILAGIVFILQFFTIIWLVVMIIYLVYKIVTYRNFSSYVKAGQIEVDNPQVLDILSDLLEQLKINKSIELYINPLISSPLLMGFNKPRIILPTTDFNQSDLKNILLHEVMHYKQKDILYIWIMQVVLALNWFNPLVHMMNKQIQKDRELTCDENVISIIGYQKRFEYGDSLLQSLSTAGNYKEAYITASLHENAKALKERLEAINQYIIPVNKTKYIMIVTTFILFISTAFFGTYHLKNTTNYSSQITLVNKSKIESKDAKQFQMQPNIALQNLDLNASFDSIDLKTSAKYIKIKKGPKESIEISKDYNMVDFKVINNVLTFNDATLKAKEGIVITLKDNKQYESITIDTLNTTVKVDEGLINNLKLLGESNTISLTKTNLETLDVSNNFGNITINNSNISNQVSLTSTQTDISISAMNTSSLNITNNQSTTIINDLKISETMNITNNGDMEIKLLSANAIIINQNTGTLSLAGEINNNLDTIFNSGSIEFIGIVNGSLRLISENLGTTTIRLTNFANDYTIVANDETLTNKLLIDNKEYLYPYNNQAFSNKKIEITNKSSVLNSNKLYFNYK